MSAEAKLMEALLRIEHKLDLILGSIVMPQQQLTKLGAIGVTCPVCSQSVQFDADIQDAVIVRKCGCSTGKIALDLKSFAPPVSPAKKETQDNGNDQEDWRDPDRGRGNRGR